MRTGQQTSLLSLVIWLAGVLAMPFCVAGSSEKAAQIIIPHIEFEDMPAAEVFTVLRKRSKELDPDGYGINFVFKFSPAGADAFRRSRLTMELDRMPLDDLIEYICMGGGFKYRFDRNAVLIFDVGEGGGKMQTKIYNLEAGVLQSLRTRKKAKKLKWRNDDD